ncbi:unnamed protein product [Brassicogethes aeneus]|uniref:MI domain-containing protein n=1 Tax=Brassicogethes aeneus TaxID=1431903 RepID=A0A9P0FNZ6_BRAAE|nr:unnamed protein product [Brassicogethes aeneus]
MGLKSRKPKVKNEKKSRKVLRKEKRKEKKIKRNDYYSKKNVKMEENEGKNNEKALKNDGKAKNVTNKNSPTKNNTSNNKGLSAEQQRAKEKNQQKNLQREMTKQRKKQLLEANVMEDRNIKKLEKQLKLNKRKGKGVPKSFDTDGLGYLLEVCDGDNMKGVAETEKELMDANDDFDEDFALMTGKEVEKPKKNKKKNKMKNDAFKENSEDEELEINEDDEDNSDFEALLNEDDESDLDIEDFSGNDDDDDLMGEEEEIKEPKSKNNNKRKHSGEKAPKDKKVRFTEDPESFEESESSENENEELEENSDTEEKKTNPDGTWEDIYGRLRAKDGSVVMTNEQKYIPPAIRAKMEAGMSESDKKRNEKLSRLRKQIKGLLNRLAEGNMHNIASQIEDLYMNNSRNDMNDTLTSLIMESLVSNVLTPERLMMEHVLLIVILHANVGTEIGAHFLQTVARKFDEYHKNDHPVENKSLDNIVIIISQLYNFKMFDSKLVYEVLEKLSDNFEEKDVECILHVLKAVGFNLRKDDPIALKNLILKLQKQAASATEATKDNARVKFMLDILLAIKNNNVTKIPNYDTTYSEHLKKIMKGFIRKGNYVTQLNITLEDLLKADERGRWWVVGSAWSGNLTENAEKSQKVKTDGFSEKLLELAAKQRMNTDTRRSIFCIIMAAEDYLDAFEKLLKLGLKNQQEREIVHVILHCCLHEKNYNPYYSVLAQKFCEYDRKYQMTIKYSVWHKLKVLNDHSGSQISNLAKLLTHLFIEKGLPISTLKIVQFSELDKITLRFIRQILLGILLHHDLESVQGVFEKVAQSEKLKMFRESLRLFIHHFLLRNLKADTIGEVQKSLLESRAKMVEKILMAKEGKVRF